MAYFDLIPNIEIEKRPLTFPFSESQYDLAKNFFKRSKLTQSSYNYNVFFNEYQLTDNDRIDYLAYKTYGRSDLDWVILLTNNIINPNFDLPIKDNLLYDAVNKAYVDSPGNQSNEPADRIHHYETLQLKNSAGQIVLAEGLKVESSFYNGTYKYFDNGLVLTKSGSEVSIPVTNFDYEKRLNDLKRKIYLLRPEYIQDFKEKFKNNLKYSRSSAYIDKNTKKAGK